MSVTYLIAFEVCALYATGGCQDWAHLRGPPHSDQESITQTHLPQRFLLSAVRTPIQYSASTLRGFLLACWLTLWWISNGLSLVRLSYSRYVDWLNTRETQSLPSQGQGEAFFLLYPWGGSQDLVPKQALTLGALPDSCQRTDVRIWPLESCICLEWLFWDKIP